MGPMLLVFAIFVVVFTLMGLLTTRLASRYVRRFLEARLMAIEAIVNHRQVPERWLARYRRRATRLAEGRAPEDAVRRLSGIARKRCLSEIQELIRLVEDRGLTNDADTKRMMLTVLREEAARWEDVSEWNELVDLTSPAPVLDQDDEAPEDVAQPGEA